MAQMTRRERMHRCYFHQEVDRPAVYLRTGYPANDPSYDAVKALMAERSELKAGWDSGRIAADAPVDWREEPVDASWKRLIATMHTPAGDLETTILASLTNLPGMCERHYIKDRADCEKWLSRPRPRLGGDVSGFSKMVAEMGDRGIVEISLGNNPGGLVAELMGSETFAMMSVNDRDVLHAMCRRAMEDTLDRLRYVLAQGLGPYFATLGQEMIVPPLHGPDDFRDFNLQYDKPIFDAIRDAGGAIHVHCHGRIAKVIGQFVEAGVSVLHPFEAPPMGDITPRQAKAAARGRMSLEGNIQIADIYEKPPYDIRRQVRELVDACFDDGRGLIVCPTASAYQFGKGRECLEQVCAMLDEATRVRA